MFLTLFLSLIFFSISIYTSAGILICLFDTEASNGKSAALIYTGATAFLITLGIILFKATWAFFILNF